MDSEILALRVALQTMKERCQDLQKRNNDLEEENKQLRSIDVKKTTQSKELNTKQGTTDEIHGNMQFKLQLNELQRQNLQLNETVNMVSKENKKLWSRLSQLAKDKDNDVGEKLGAARAVIESASSVSNNQNLIRSKTFTKHSPNPQLRAKVMTNDLSSDLQNLSLDDIALNESELDSTLCTIQQSQITGRQECGFAYINMDDSVDVLTGGPNDSDSNAETQKNLAALQELKDEALRQQQDMKIVLNRLQQKLASRVCAECILRSKKPETADKSLETDESLHEVVPPAVKKNTASEYLQAANEDTADSINDELACKTANNAISKETNKTPVQPASSTTTTAHVNFIQEKIDADNIVKTCPVCGRIFSEYVEFQKFLEHVESHFVGDTSDLGSSLNYEYISHAVGDF